MKKLTKIIGITVVAIAIVWMEFNCCGSCLSYLCKTSPGFTLEANTELDCLGSNLDK